MPIFKSKEQAQDVHSSYCYDTDHEGKFTERHTGWDRTKQLLDWMPDDYPIFLGIGCNSGGLESLIMKRVEGSVGYGIDIQPEMIERAKSKGIIATHGKAENLPYSDNYFDAVILSECLEHFYSAEDVLAEGMRVLKPGGLVIGSVPHPKGLNSNKRTIEEHAYHTRIYTPKTLKKLLSPLKDVELVDIKYVNTPCFTKQSTKYMDKPQWMAFKGTKCE